MAQDMHAKTLESMSGCSNLSLNLACIQQLPKDKIFELSSALMVVYHLADQAGGLQFIYLNHNLQVRFSFIKEDRFILSLNKTAWSDPM